MKDFGNQHIRHRLTMNRILCLLIIAASGLSCLEASSNPRKQTVRLPEEDLKALDKTLQISDKIIDGMLLDIDSLLHFFPISQVSPSRELWNLNMQIGEKYKPLSADSALKYFNRARNISEILNLDTLILQSRISQLDALGRAGIFVQAQSLLDSISGKNMSLQLKTDLWKNARQLYSYMKVYVAGHEGYAKEYNDMMLAYEDSLIDVLLPTDKFCQFLHGERMVRNGQYKEACKTLEDLLSQVPEDSNIYGMAAYQLAEVYRNVGNELMYASYLSKSAISDLKCGIREGFSLPALAGWLYSQGDVDRAYRYINASLKEAMKGNSRMRANAIAELVPHIDDAYKKKINSSRDELMVYFLLAAFLVVVSGVLLFFLIKQMRKIKETQKHLQTTSKIQESYIGNFLGLCSSYADRFDSLCKLVNRKISAGQTDELLKMVKSGLFSDDQNDDFYKIFDNAFLDLYPDFIFEINKLLREEEQIVLKKGQGLTAELRIYAFVRIGIGESTRIAQILHYSVNTVYTYRNKMRNKAIDRENFDTDVMKIGHNY